MALDYLTKYNWKKSFAKEPESSNFIEPEDILNRNLHEEIDDEPILPFIDPSSNSRPVIDPTLICRTHLKSRFNKEQHTTFIEACKINNSGKKHSYQEKQILEIYNKSEMQIKEENRTFSREAENSWGKRKKLLRVRPDMSVRGEKLRNYKIQKVFKLPRFYRKIDSLSFFHSESDIPVQAKHEQNLLDVGDIAQFDPPLPMESFRLSPKAVAEHKDEIYHSQLPVSQDRNVEVLLKNNDIQFAISMSALKKIMDFTATTQSFNIPVVVREVDKSLANGENIKQSMVFIDKVLAKQNVNHFEINYNFYKYLIKSNLCHRKGMSYPKQADKIEQTEPISQRDEAITYLRTKKKNCNDSEILEKLDETEIFRGPIKRPLIHNASYKMWTIQQIDDSPALMKKHSQNYFYKILIRSKIDAYEVVDNYFLHPLLVIPKFEYQPSFGANTFTKSELMNQWTSLNFNPNSHIARVRCGYNKPLIYKVEKSNIQQVNNEIHSLYKHKPQLGFGVLYKICFGLKNCTPGNYLLRYEPKDGSFINLLQEVTENFTFDLHDAYTSHISINKGYKKPWNPIDPHIQLSHFTKLQHKSGLLPPNTNTDIAITGRRDWKTLKKNKKEMRKVNQKLKLGERSKPLEI